MTNRSHASVKTLILAGYPVSPWSGVMPPKHVLRELLDIYGLVLESSVPRKPRNGEYFLDNNGYDPIRCTAGLEDREKRLILVDEPTKELELPEEIP